MIKVEDPNAYRFILQDEVYLLPGDKAPLTATVTTVEAPPAQVSKAPDTSSPVAPVQTPVVTTQPLTEVKTSDAGFNYLGDNNKNFLILTNYASAEFIEPAHLTALENVLKRKETALSDVAIVNTHTYPGVTIKALSGHFKPQKMLILGAAAMPAGMPALKLNSVTQGKSTILMYSFSFAEMMESNEKQKSLLG